MKSVSSSCPNDAFDRILLKSSNSSNNDTARETKREENPAILANSHDQPVIPLPLTIRLFFPLCPFLALCIVLFLSLSLSSSLSLCLVLFNEHSTFIPRRNSFPSLLLPWVFTENTSSSRRTSICLAVGDRREVWQYFFLLLFFSPPKMQSFIGKLNRAADLSSHVILLHPFPRFPFIQI